MKHDLFIENLMNEFHENKLSHAFLVQTNNFNRTLDSLYYFIKVINCPNVYKNNCNDCSLCKLIDTNNLPSLIVIQPDGNVIKKEQLINLKESFMSKPIYSKYNIYIVMNAELLNSASANTILKFLEEPEDNIIGFFITNNKDNVMETIQSRCQILQDFYDDNDTIDTSFLDLACSFLKQVDYKNILFNRDELIERIQTRGDLVSFLKTLFYVFEQLLDVSLCNNKLKYSEFEFLCNKNIKYYISWLNLLKKYLHRANYNVNILLTLDSLVLEAPVV